MYGICPETDKQDLQQRGLLLIFTGFPFKSSGLTGTHLQALRK